MRLGVKNSHGAAIYGCEKHCRRSSMNRVQFLPEFLEPRSKRLAKFFFQIFFQKFFQFFFKQRIKNFQFFMKNFQFFFKNFQFFFQKFSIFFSKIFNFFSNFYSKIFNFSSKLFFKFFSNYECWFFYLKKNFNSSWRWIFQTEPFDRNMNVPLVIPGIGLQDKNFEN